MQLSSAAKHGNNLGDNPSGNPRDYSSDYPSDYSSDYPLTPVVLQLINARAQLLKRLAAHLKTEVPSKQKVVHHQMPT